MRMGASLKKDKRGTGVGMTAYSFATVPVASLAVSSLNCIKNKARDQVWNLGDQAMRKMTGSCFQ